LESTGEGIIGTDSEGRCTFINKAGAEFLGYLPQELQGKNVHRLIHHSNLNGSDYPYENCPLSSTILKGTVFQGDEEILWRKDGTYFWAIYSSYPVMDGNKVKGAVIVFRDITGRKALEAEALATKDKLEAALASMNDAVFISDTEGRLIVFNEAFATFHKFKNKEECLKTLSDYYELLEVYTDNGESASLNQWVVSRALQGETGTNVEFSLKRKDTGDTWIGSFSFSPIRDKEGAIVGAVVVGRDITERKRMEKQVRSLGHQLLKSQEDEKRRLSRELHDVIGQNLLTLKMGLDGLFKSLAEKHSESMSKNLELSALIKQTIEDIRDMAHELRPSSLDQLGLVKAGLQYCEEFSLKNNIQVDFSAVGIRESQFDYETKITFYRLIQEGLNNIRKHSGASRVTIRLVSSFPNIILRIEDNGRGFDLKNSMDLAVQEKHLGLISMTERVSILQGQLKIESQPGKGTKILIEVPSQEATIKWPIR
jgi:PAS domain S-box-containing protein